MEFKAEQKYAKISPTKVRPLVLRIKPMEIGEALEILPLVPNRGASFLIKVIKSAVANAVQKGFSVSDLAFKEILVNEGPCFKRGRPVSRGMWHPYVRRTSHIKVVLQTKDKSRESINNVDEGDIKKGKKIKMDKIGAIKSKGKIKAKDKVEKKGVKSENINR